jgi:hypothetical protein
MGDMDRRRNPPCILSVCSSAWVELIDRASIGWVLALALRTAVFKGHGKDRGAQWT